jgi:thioredoxin-like negative regulator of GroEL
MFQWLDRILGRFPPPPMEEIRKVQDQAQMAKEDLEESTEHLRNVLRDIAESADPIAELIKALTSARSDPPIRNQSSGGYQNVRDGRKPTTH